MKQLILVFLIWNLMSCTTELNTENTTTTKQVDPNQIGEGTPEIESTAVENDLAKKNLQGKIKSREVLVYEAKIKDGYVTNGAAKGGIKTTYNEAGNKVELVNYDEQQKVMNTWKYKYDEQHNLLESIFSDATVRHKMTYDYNDKNQLLSTKEYVNEALVKQVAYVYDAAGNKIEEEAYFTESKGKSRSVHTYDENRNLRETKIYDEKKELQIKQLYTYNDAGQEIQQSIFTGDNAPSYKRKSEYDAKGNKTKDLAFTGNGVVNPSDSYKYKYEYDKNKNWTTQIRYNYNDVADQFMEQKITYYE